MTPAWKRMLAVLVSPGRPLLDLLILKTHINAPIQPYQGRSEPQDCQRWCVVHVPTRHHFDLAANPAQHETSSAT